MHRKSHPVYTQQLFPGFSFGSLRKRAKSYNKERLGDEGTVLWDGDGSESPRLNTSLCFKLGVCARPAMLSPASLQISFHCPVKLFFSLFI